jgi:hypothetical protein
VTVNRALAASLTLPPANTAAIEPAAANT